MMELICLNWIVLLFHLGEIDRLELNYVAISFGLQCDNADRSEESVTYKILELGVILIFFVT